MKTLNYLFVFLGLFILDVVYSSLFLILLDKLGLDIYSFSIHFRSIILILISISFMFILYLIYRKELNKELVRFFRNFRSYFSFGFKCWIFGLIIMLVSNIIIQSIYPSGPKNEDLVQEALALTPLYMTFSSCIFAPFVEEIIFRKALRKAFTNNFLFILVSGLLFGLVHNLSSMDTNQLLYIIPYGAFGSVFAYLYVKTNNIFSSIMFHFIHNTILVTISLASMGVI